MTGTRTRDAKVALSQVQRPNHYTTESLCVYDYYCCCCCLFLLCSCNPVELSLELIKGNLLTYFRWTNRELYSNYWVMRARILLFQDFTHEIIIVRVSSYVLSYTFYIDHFCCNQDLATSLGSARPWHTHDSCYVEYLKLRHTTAMSTVILCESGSQECQHISLLGWCWCVDVVNCCSSISV